MDIQLKFEELETYIPQYEKINTKVSKVSVGWHIGHSLKVINGVCHLLVSSEPTTYKPKLNLFWQYVRLRKGFPRGTAKAPKATRPAEGLTQKELLGFAEKCKTKLNDLANQIPQGAYFGHPHFGHLNYKQSLAFLVIHTHHHIKIIRDIVKE